jgi:hypothetical protein
MWSYRICDDLYKTLNKYLNKIYLLYVIESIFSPTYYKEEVGQNSSVLKMIRYTWCVFDSRSIIRA